ncbi:hypothetical protein AB9P05_13000 [Roseivirga sp. BDSF3-8]|uniref:hypothetical protein n=1 Tax=Roseivirga sp. BDSF3-8 TaxID=3241598 RepID=UPI003531EBCE
MKKKYTLLLTGIAIGVAYGIITRLVFGQQATLASITYLFFIPTILGIIPLIFANDEQIKSYRNIIFVPWLCIATFFLTMYLMGIEDIICLLILGGPFFILATVGALIYKLIKLHRQKRKNTLLTVILLPFLLAPVEELISTPSHEYHVVSEISIASAPESIWKKIIRVPAISEAEYQPGIFHSLGIPRPVEATLSGERPGGQRTGIFQGGLRFNETIQDWEPHRRVSFAIVVDPATVGPKVLDQHVLNGNYFHFTNATYELQKQENGQTILRLTSGYKLTSRVNFYGKLWGEWILSDFQNRLLEVIKHRCEAEEKLNAEQNHPVIK